MNDIRHRLASTLEACSYCLAPDDHRLTPLVEKIEFLQSVGRYGRLLEGLFAANDAANLRSLILEGTFACHFEMADLPLQYEVSRRLDDETSVDFVRPTDWGKDLCIEMRLVQQRQALTTLFEEQLRHSDYFEALIDGAGDRADTLRLQRLILEKAVNAGGDLVKFQADDTATYNIVAVEVSELHLGMLDDIDCVLATYGDPAVPDHARRGLFGLFQEVLPHYPAHIREVAERFAPFRSAVHAVLFLRKVPPEHPIDYVLEYILVHNQHLLSSDEGGRVAEEFNQAMEVWGSVRDRA